MNIVVRKATIDDIPDIHEIVKQAFTKYLEDLGTSHKLAALEEDYKTIEEDIKTKNVYIALLDGKPVGTIRYHMISDDTAYISRFAVKPNSQKCGVGRTLMLTVERDVMNKDKGTRIALHTCSKMFSLVRFYYGLNYYIHSTSTDRGYIRALLYKELDSQGKNCENQVISYACCK
ncbi:MAG TPA: GNAT family N-acetyltransferase [Clostridiales bacterium]|nr:GNAT family N-acetyltransferase [Clostridiales bacterium]